MICVDIDEVAVLNFAFYLLGSKRRIDDVDSEREESESISQMDH